MAFFQSFQWWELECYILMYFIRQSLPVTNWYLMADFQTLNCRYSFRIQLTWPKFFMASVTRYDLLSQLDIPPLYTSRLVAMLWQHQRSVCSVSNDRRKQWCSMLQDFTGSQTNNVCIAASRNDSHGTHGIRQKILSCNKSTDLPLFSTCCATCNPCKLLTSYNLFENHVKITFFIAFWT